MHDLCELVHQPAQSVLSLRTRTPISNITQVCGSTYTAIMQYLSSIGENPSGPPFVAYYNMDMNDLDIELGFPVLKALPGTNEIKPGEIPAGKYAECLYTGPYCNVEPAYNALMKWIEENGYKSTGTCYEFYLNDPAVTPEDKLQTMILFQLM